MIAVFIASRSWCQITPLTQLCYMSSGISGPQIQIWPPQTAAARNAPGHAAKEHELTCKALTITSMKRCTHVAITRCS